MNEVYRALIGQMNEKLERVGNKKSAYPEMDALYQAADDYLDSQDKPGCIPFRVLRSLIYGAVNDLKGVDGHLALGLEAGRVRNYIRTLESLIAYQEEHYPHMHDQSMTHHAVMKEAAKKLKKND